MLDGMKVILSLGAGVNSSALLVKYKDLIDEVIWANTLVERPETYAYIESHLKPLCRAEGIGWHEVRNKWNEPLHEHYIKIKTMPNRRYRMCTREFKIEPIMKRARELGATKTSPMIEFIGIAFDEAHRARLTPHDEPYLIKRWPLIDDKITRQGCIRILKRARYPVPVKSGCQGCFFKSRRELLEFYRRDPIEFGKWMKLEESAKNFPKYTWHESKKTMRSLTELGSMDDFLESDVPPATCDSGYCMDVGS